MPRDGIAVLNSRPGGELVDRLLVVFHQDSSRSSTSHRLGQETSRADVNTEQQIGRTAWSCRKQTCRITAAIVSQTFTAADE